MNGRGLASQGKRAIFATIGLDLLAGVTGARGTARVLSGKARKGDYTKAAGTAQLAMLAVGVATGGFGLLGSGLFYGASVAYRSHRDIHRARKQYRKRQFRRTKGYKAYRKVATSPYVRAYTKRDGTKVRAHGRAAPGRGRNPPQRGRRTRV